MSREKPYLSTDLAHTPLNKLQVENKPQIDKFLSKLLLNQEMIINIYQYWAKNWTQKWSILLITCSKVNMVQNLVATLH